MSTSELVDTKKVTGRREVLFNNYDEQLADAERLAGMEVRTLGNWSFGQILSHLARSIDAMIGKLLKADSDLFQFRHAEMHMSFVVPGDA